MKWNESIVTNMPDISLGYYCSLYDKANWFYNMYRLHPSYGWTDTPFNEFPDKTVHYHMYLIYRFIKVGVGEMICHIHNDPLAYQILVAGEWKDRYTVKFKEWEDIYSKIQLDIPVFEESS